MQSAVIWIFCCLALLLQGCGKATESLVSKVRYGSYQVLVRSQEIDNSSIHNVDICVAKQSESVFPTDQKQCFLHGFDFSKLLVKWRTGTVIEVSFQCGRVDQFRNSAFLYPNGPVPVQFYIVLNDTCNASRN